MNLGFVGAAIAHDGLLHLQRGVFSHVQVGVHQRRHQSATRLAQQQRGLRVDIDKDDFNGRAVWLVAGDDLAHAVEQHFQARGQRFGVELLGGDGAAGHVAQRSSLLINHAKTGGAQARVDSQNPHGRALGKRASGMRATITWARSLK